MLPPLTLMPSSAPPVTVRTIEIYRHVLGYTRRKPPIWHIDTERTARLRAEWVAQYKDADHLKWVYMDESTLCLRDTGEYVWVKRGDETPPHEIRHLRCHVNVWGAVWDNGAVFDFYTGYLNSDAYINILNTHLSQHKHHFVGRTLLHDRAPSHTSGNTKSWCDEQGLDMLCLPPHSPQFNAIEGVWGWLKRKVRQQHPSDHTALQTAMREAWKALPQSVVQGFIRNAHDHIIARKSCAYKLYISV
jgi:transposase